MTIRRGPFQAGEKVQFSDAKGKRVTEQLVPGGHTQTDHGLIVHDLVIGLPEGTVVTTVRNLGESRADATDGAHADAAKPWKSARSMGGWQFVALRPRMADYVLSMPRGAQIMYPKDIAQVLQLGDIRSGMRVLESGAGSGALSLNLLDAVGDGGNVTTIELRKEFARVAEANVTLYYGVRPPWWDLRTGDFDAVVPTLQEHVYDRVVLDMLDPWNRLDQVHRAIVPGGVLTMYVTTTTQISRIAQALRAAETWTEPEILETAERGWKAEGLAVRPDHQMIGHTGFLVITRSMASGCRALRKRGRATKDSVTDIDALSPDQRATRIEELELRDISDRKLRKVLRDLGEQLDAMT